MRLCVTILCTLIIFPASVWAGTLSEPLSLESDRQSQEIINKLEDKNDTLFEALSLAYENSPVLRAARAELKAVEERLPQAQAGYKPTVIANTDVTHTDTETKGTSFFTSDGPITTKSAIVNAEQPLFRGGSTIANINEAKNIIGAQQLSLSGTEQGIIYDTAVAYMDVLQDTVVMALNESNLELVKKEMERAQDGFKLGVLTRTDVSQSESRMAEAEAAVITAQGNLARSVAVYQRLVGTPPTANISFPAKNLFLPETMEEALSYASSNNREVLRTKFMSAAAENSVDSASGELLPQISAKGSVSKVYDQNDFAEEQEQTSIGLNASIPLYEAGATRSRIREAKKRANQRYLEILEAENKAREEAVGDWEALKAAKAEIAAREKQVEAARIAREGVHYETEFGERTILDSLDANQELLDAQVKLVTAKRNEVVAQFALARTLGLLVPQKLGFSTIDP